MAAVEGRGSIPWAMVRTRICATLAVAVSSVNTMLSSNVIRQTHHFQDAASAAPTCTRLGSEEITRWARVSIDVRHIFPSVSSLHDPTQENGPKRRLSISNGAGAWIASCVKSACRGLTR